MAANNTNTNTNNDLAKMMQSMTQNLGNDFPGKLMQVAQSIAQDIDSTNPKDGSPPDISKMMNATMQKLSGMMQSGELNQVLGNQGDQPQISSPSPPENEKKSIEEVDDEDYTETTDEVVKPKTDDFYHTLKVKLEHLYTGRKKKIAYRRSNYKIVDSKVERFEEKKILVIPILPGTKHGDIITFDQQADNIPGHTPGNVVITIEEIESKDSDEDESQDSGKFIRDNDNLLYIQNIELYENYALDRVITHLDGKKYRIKTPVGEAIISSNDDDRSNGLRKVIGAGMSIKNSDKFGDLYIRFNLNLPDKLELKDAQKLVSIFSDEPSDETSEEDVKILKLEKITEDDYYNQFNGYYDSDVDEYTSEEDSESEGDDDEEEDGEEEDGEEEDEEDDPSDDPTVFFGEDKKLEEKVKEVEKKLLKEEKQ